MIHLSAHDPSKPRSSLSSNGNSGADGAVKTIDRLFQKNREWSRRMREQDPEFFRELSKQQSPAYLWIGCSDSRVPANEIVDLLPGELFVHRNVANLVVHSDFNCLSVLQFAVDHLKVRHIIVCGHYGCSGVRAVMARERLGLSDNWLRHLHDIRQRHEDLLASAGNESEALNRLCELNVIEQVGNVCGTSIVREAWERGQELSVHGWIYGLHDGLLRDLKTTTQCSEDSGKSYRIAVDTLRGDVPAEAGLARP
jgi:carbonic anhydrase